MKKQPNDQPYYQTRLFSGMNSSNHSLVRSHGASFNAHELERTGAALSRPNSSADPSHLLTEEAAPEIMRGDIPDLSTVCHELYRTFFQRSAPYSALQFIPVLKKLDSIDQGEAERFLKNPKTSHVLVQNALLKVVLIRWEPGKLSSIHGHPGGGCVFKVLQGRLEEKRYSPEESPGLLSVSTFQEGALAYIDDDMAYHAVGNPFDEPAFSIHAYTPGR